MRYNVIIDCPDDEKIVQAILDAAANAGAGGAEKYSRCASLTKVTGTWKTEPGAHPYIGTAGEISVVNSVKIEMLCEEEHIKTVLTAVKRVHPYEEPMIHVVKLEEFD